MTRKQGTRRVSILASLALLREIDREVKRQKKINPDATKSSVIRELLQKGLPRKATNQKEKVEFYKKYVEEARILKLRAEKHDSIGESRDARSCYLKAASRELEALAVLDNPNAKVTISALIEVIFLIKKATGFKHLPTFKSF